MWYVCVKANGCAIEKKGSKGRLNGSKTSRRAHEESQVLLYI